MALDHLYRFAGAVGTTVEIRDLLEDALEPLLAMAESTQVLVAVSEGEDAPLTVAEHRGWTTPPSFELSAEEIAALAPDTREYPDPQSLPEPFATLFAEHSGRYALILLRARGELLGFIVLVRTEGPQFGPATLRLLGIAGRQLALALESSKLFADLQRSYRQLVDMQEDLIRSESLSALGGLAATMAHEIRNPLSTIFSAISQVRKHAQVTGDSATLLDIAEEEVVRLNKMVTGLLEFARPRAPRLRPIKPADIAKDAVWSSIQNPEIPDNIEISLKPGGEELEGEFDPQLLERALHHLITNSAAAMDGQAGRIDVTVQPLVDRQGVEVSVTDTGCGIPAKVRASIFEPFFSTKASGVGLGLSVVKRIVEDHGGTLEIDSATGTGTTVRLFFVKREAEGTDTGEETANGGENEAP